MDKPLLSLREVVEARLTAIRQRQWADPTCRLELTYVGRDVAPWATLVSPSMKDCPVNGDIWRQSVLIITFDQDARIWLAFE